MSRHVADRRAESTGSRTRQFLRLARGTRQGWLAHRAGAGASRLIQFLRIARGRQA